MIFRKILNSFKKKDYQTTIERIDTSNVEGVGSSLKRIINLLNYTKKSAVSYSAINFDTGYHSMTIDGHEFKGQRKPKERFENLGIDLAGKSVLDLGCNQGAMTATFADKIKWGVGLDYDARMINVANKIRAHRNLHNVDYYVFNFEDEKLGYISDFLREDKVDVVLLLSVCMWIQNWKQLIDYSRSISSFMVFESNGKDHQQKEQEDYLRQIYSTVTMVNDKSDDDESQKNRKLFLCQ